MNKLSLYKHSYYKFYFPLRFNTLNDIASDIIKYSSFIIVYIINDLAENLMKSIF